MLTVSLHLSRRAWGLLATLTLVLLPAAAPPPVSAQNEPRPKGTLQGRILDAESGEPLLFANVIFLRVTRENPDGEPAGGAMGTGEGTYSAKVEPGNYTVVFSYISYQKTVVSGVFVPAGETVTVDGLLAPEAITVGKVEVKAKAVRTAEGSMLTALKKAPAVSEAVTSEAIGKAGDSNAAQALERVTGISVVGDRYVFVRGLGERYSSTTVNGSAVGTPETNRRVVPLDLFPSGVLDNIVVQKTYTPDMEADFGGGVVNINTRDFVEGQSLRQSLSLGYSEYGTGDGFLTYEGGGLDFLGFDDGTRALPDVVKDAGQRIDRFNYSLEERREMTRAFSNVWTPRRDSGSPNFSYSGVYSRGFRLLGRDAGFLASASLSNSFATREKTENTFVSGEPLTLYDVDQATREVLGGVTGSLSMKLDEETGDRLKLNLLYTRSSEDIVKVSEGLNEDLGVETARQTDIAYLERGVFQGVVQGEHSLGLLGTGLSWNLGYSEAVKSEPDRRRYIYQKEASSDELILGGRSAHPFQRTFGAGHEYTRTLRLDWTTPAGLFHSGETKFQYGFFHRTKNRDSDYRRFGFSCLRGGNCDVDRTLSPEFLIAPDTLDTPNYLLEELTKDNDSWTASEATDAAYFMVDAPVFSWLRVVTGARYEDAGQAVLARSQYAIRGQTEAVEVENGDAGWLPSVNMTMTPGRRTNVRLAYAETLNRPELRELSPFEYFNFDKGWQEAGNPDLRTARIDNYDLRLEYYAGPGELLALGVFRKDFDRPIQKRLAPLATGFQEIPENADKGRLEGYEAEVRVSFVSLWRALDWMVDLETEEIPEGLLRWSVLANYSRVDSEAELELPGVGRQRTAFTGQSDYSVNVGLFYRSQRWEGSLLYKAFGERLALFSLSSQFENLTERPADDLDLNLAYRINGSAQVKFGIRNLLDEETRYTLGNELLTQKYKRGRTVGMSISYTPEPAGEE